MDVIRIPSGDDEASAVLMHNITRLRFWIDGREYRAFHSSESAIV